MMAEAAISVVIPLYNKGDFILEAISSVLSGTRLPTEILVVDDGSTDHGPALAATHAHPLVRLIRQPNGGVSVARNRGVAEARGNYIAFLDADDYWEPDYLERIAALIRLHPACALYATSFYGLHPDGRRSLPALHGEARSGGPCRVRHFYEAWSRGNFFFTSSIVAPAHLLRTHGIAFPPGERLGEDQDVWFRLAELGDVGFDPHPAVAYRLAVAGSLTSASMGDGPLPYLQRLAVRHRAGQLPRHERRGAARLLAAERIGRAIRLRRAGDRAGAVRLLMGSFTLRAPRFWLHAALQVLGT